jgi:hypothetical protein
VIIHFSEVKAGTQVIMQLSVMSAPAFNIPHASMQVMIGTDMKETYYYEFEK